MLLSQSNAICLMKNKLNCNEINTGYGKERGVFGPDDIVWFSYGIQIALLITGVLFQLLNN